MIKKAYMAVINGEKLYFAHNSAGYYMACGMLLELGASIEITTVEVAACKKLIGE